MIRERDCATAQHLFFDSGVAEEFRAMLRRNSRGRKPGFDPALFLVGMFLTAQLFSRTHISAMHEVLTEGVPLDWQVKWGIRQDRTDRHGNEFTWVLSVDDLENVSNAIRKRLNYSTNYVPDDVVPGDRAAERANRKVRLEAFSDLLLSVASIARPDGAEDYAMDSTGVWASERARKPAPASLPNQEADPSDEPNGPGDQPTGHIEASDAAVAAPFKRRVDSDATWGSKTRKDGTSESFFGYEMHTLVRVPERRGRDGIRNEPALVEAIRVTPAARDVVEPSLALLDRVLSQDRRIRYLMVDRHYSHKKFERWALELVRREIQQVVDLHQADQGFTDWNGALVAAGWVHCPFTPQHLGSIPTLSPNASDKTVANFRSLIDQREQYAARLSKPMTENGTTRWECPALNGKIGCPRRKGTVQTAHQFNLPIVPATVPEDPAQMPALCRQQSISLTPVTHEQMTLMKVHQRHYWGSIKQRDLYGRRTYVEGAFGTLKGDTAVNKKRGSSLYTGLAHTTLELTIFMVLTNLRLLRAWHKATGQGDADHPLLAAKQPALRNSRTIDVSEDEYRQILQARLRVA